MYVLGIRFRAGYLGMAYRKLLKLRQIKGKDLAEVFTFKSVQFKITLLQLRKLKHFSQ